MKAQILLNHVKKIDCLYLDEILYTNDEVVIECSNDINTIVKAIEYVDDIYLTGEIGFYGRWRILQDCNKIFYLVERKF